MGDENIDAVGRVNLLEKTVQDYRNNLTKEYHMLPYWKLKDRDYICNVCAATVTISFEGDYQAATCEDCGDLIYPGYRYCVKCALAKKICIDCGNFIQVYYHYH